MTRRTNRMKPKPAVVKGFRPGKVPSVNLKEKKTKMISRAADINRVNSDLKALEDEGNAVIQKYQEYHAQVGNTVKEIMAEAGVWDEVHALEMEREDVRKAAEGKIAKIREAAQDLLKVRQYILNLKDSPESVVETPLVPVYPPIEPQVEEPVSEDPAVIESSSEEPAQVSEEITSEEPVSVTDLPVTKSRPTPPIF